MKSIVMYFYCMTHSFTFFSFASLQIPETDAECRWDWRYARCEPFCSCHLRPQWGDFHVGRACRMRTLDSTDHNNHTHAPPDQCDVPPNTPYTHLVDKARERAKHVRAKTKTSLQNWKQKAETKWDRIQTETCDTLPEECPDDEDYHRTWKERLLCSHIPSPCHNDDEDLVSDKARVSSDDAEELLNKPVDKTHVSDEE